MLKWYYYVLLSVIALSALSMTWWSMFDLGVQTLSAPVLVAAIASVIFDLTGVYLGAMAIEYAKTSDSGFWTELGTYLFIAGSTYVVVRHAIIDGYPDAGIVMFAAAPIALGIVLKVTLNFITRQQRKQVGRVTEKLPSVGWLTWIRYGPQAFKLASVAMQGRLINAADKLDIAQDKHNIFGQTKTLHVKSSVLPETIVETRELTDETDTRTSVNSENQLSQPPVRPVLTSGNSVSLPVWLPHEPTMTLGKLVRTCMDNGVFDLETMFRYAKDIKGQEVNKLSLSRTLAREKTKA